MAHVIAQACVKDASCVPVCPVGAIRPGPDEADFAFTDMLYIDPVVCIDCGACLRACPVSAVRHDEDVRADTPLYVTVNGGYFIGRSGQDDTGEGRR